MKSTLKQLAVALACVCLVGLSSAHAHTNYYCPEIVLGVQPESAIEKCTGSVITAYAYIVEHIPGQHQGASFEYDSLHWYWQVEDVSAAPQKGRGSYAQFTNLSAGVGTVRFFLEVKSIEVPHCDTTYEISKEFTSQDLLLSISKSYLGINLFDPPGVSRDQLTGTATVTPDAYALYWSLSGSSVLETTPGYSDHIVTIKENGIPSANYQGEVLCVSRICLNRCKQFTVVKLNIDAGVAEDKEENPGIFLSVNDNDSDNSGKPDNTETSLLADDPDLAPIFLTINPADLPASQMVILRGIENCYEDRRKQKKVASSYKIARLRSGLTLYLEANASGASELVAVHPTSDECDKIKYTVLKVDLDVDSDYDGDIDDTDELIEESLGGIVCVNQDDDNKNSIADKNEAGAITDENDLRPIYLKFDPCAMNTGVLSLDAISGANKITVWQSATKDIEVPLPKTWTVGRETLPSALYIEGLEPSMEARDVELQLRYTSGCSSCDDTINLTIIRPRLVPDWSHDRRINMYDENQATTANPFRFWINDDDDQSADGGDDAPSGGNSDVGDDQVDSVRDLVDFFPLFVDLKGVLDLLGTKDFTYTLQYDLGGIGFVYTELLPDHAGDYLTDSAVAESIAGATVNHITGLGNGHPLADAFLSDVQNHGGGVVLVEGQFTSPAPLVLSIISSAGQLIGSVELPLSMSGVEDMFRWINLRHVAGGSESRPTNISEPYNYPDRLSNGKQFVFIYGFNVSERGARASNSELFKRMYWAGSHAMYTAVAWYGDETPGVLPPAAYYHADVINAFQTAFALAAEITALPGQKYLAAHSLGNMVVSSAIVDHGLNPERYFMIDAAVAMEAYKSSARYPLEIEEAPWPDYTNRVWASEWHRLFDPSDGRYRLTWRGRFGNIPQAINYYSTGEDVLNNNDPPVNMYLPRNEKAWVFQEKVKGGVLPAMLIGVDSHGGWSFNHAYDIQVGEDDLGNPLYETMPPNQATLLSVPQLQTSPFFKRFNNNGLFGANGSLVATNSEVRGKLLAEALPATSRATGRNEVSLTFNDNCDLMLMKTGWPAKRASGNWLHGDYKNVAFLYVHQFFSDMVVKGGLQ